MRLTASILIQRSIAEVFAFVSNPAVLSSWVAGVAAADGPTPPEHGIGETFVVQGSASPRPASSTWEVTSYEPPRSLALRCLDDTRASEARWTLEGCHSGATHVRIDADLTAIGFFPPASVHLKALGTRQLEADLQHLRSQLEDDTAGGTR